MESKRKRSIVGELETIRKRGGGILRPVEVVAFARKKTTALHDRFEWDDSVAAERFRLEQARHLIRCTVRMINDDSPPIHAYVSLEDDRKGGDSYRALVDVMSDTELREKLLEQALREADAWRDRYERFTELSPIVKAIRKVSKRGKRQVATVG